MKRFWSRICGFVSEHDLFFRLFLILFGCIILPVSIACIAFNWQAENLVRTQTERTNSAYLTSLSTQLESALNAQRMQMLDYSVKETLTGSFRSNKFTKDATTLLTNALSSNENLEAVFVLDPGTNRIASNIGCFDAEIYFSKYCRFPGYSFEELYGTLCENRAFSFIGALDYTRYSLVKNRQDSRALLLLYTYFPEQSYGTNRVMGFVLSPSLAEALLDDRFQQQFPRFGMGQVLSVPERCVCPSSAQNGAMAGSVDLCVGSHIDAFSGSRDPVYGVCDLLQSWNGNVRKAAAFNCKRAKLPRHGDRGVLRADEISGFLRVFQVDGV